MTLVSIIMPAYNSEKYIRKAINSVINQTFQQWELIIIDDCSTDKTSNVIEKYKKEYSAIRSIKNEKNIGVSESRNKGISLALGSWIAFLDSDDIWDNQKLEKQMRYAKNNSVGFVFAGSSYIDEQGKDYEGIFEVPSKVDFKKLRKHNVISCSSVLIKKEYLKNVKMEHDDMHEDFAFWLKILKKDKVAYGINEPLLKYRISKHSKSGNKAKTLKMTYKVYRYVGLDPFKSAYFTCSHIVGSIKKYKRLKI